MRKTLKMVVLGMAMGVIGAVAFPAQEAEAQVSAPNQPPPPVCCSSCNPNYQQCAIRAGNNTASLLSCQIVRTVCEGNCNHTC